MSVYSVTECQPFSTNLLNLLPVGKVTDITRHLLRRRAQTSNSVGNDQINLSRVGLGRNVVAGREPKLFAKELIELVALSSVALENLQERCLGASRALGATELEFAPDLLDAVEVEHEILRPGGGTLPHGDELSCLKMSICQGGLG